MSLHSPIWDAIEEALRWWTAEHTATIAGVPDPDHTALIWGDPDPLRTTLTRFVRALRADPDLPATTAIQQAIRRWAATMASRHNNNHPWPHPTPRRTFPPPSLTDPTT